MPKVTVEFQEYFGHPALGNEVVGIHRIRMTNATSNHLDAAGGLIDAELFNETRTAAHGLTFYIGGAGNTNHVAIDGATIGDRFTMITRHKGTVNVGDDRA